ncbi:MAG TPA: hypothetical protein VNX68_03510 [Nitrosopumilaceae archaeon]|nr:hypothetical protein [Nitrosopumilaceae archaeon]
MATTATNDVSKFYEAMLSFPGMNQKIKVGIKISRTNVLLLKLIIEYGLMMKNGERFNEMLEVIPEDTRKELAELSQELLGKADLISLYEKLNTL